METVIERKIVRKKAGSWIGQKDDSCGIRKPVKAFPANAYG